MMSVEIGAGLAYMEQTPLYFYKTFVDQNRPIHPSGIIPEKRKKLYAGSRNPYIFDLINIPNSIIYSVNHKNKLDEDIVNSCNTINDLLGYYYKCSEGTDENRFAEGRKRIIFPSDKNLHFNEFSFAFYSRFFFNRPERLDNFYYHLSFKQPYFALAEKIANYIGKFRGMHIRLTDHANKYDSSVKNIYKSQEEFKNKDMRLIVSTDDKEKVKNEIGINCVFVDDIITDIFANEFMALPYHNEVVFGLMSLLVMSYAEEFIGTPGSTFSAYIHRLRIYKNCDDIINIKSGKQSDNYKQNGPYSWNGFDMHTNTKNWWREWKECRLCVKKH